MKCMRYMALLICLSINYANAQSTIETASIVAVSPIQYSGNAMSVKVVLSTPVTCGSVSSDTVWHSAGSLNSNDAQAAAIALYTSLVNAAQKGLMIEVDTSRLSYSTSYSSALGCMANIHVSNTALNSAFTIYYQ
ncbi:hypothetical protein GCM10011403_11570 [Pseudohongiella nitratireducens]|uniref:Uncharacterized protein n=2 Tax=Pseudohongiella nitratireducens TaxID=1768907 RepID=A0A917GTQ3_9GAMM|nr:hypothetical protein [Pseudohongiella nitratireducens]GGG56113.1 hypothetical protein GCM10011403_11570 [Pseudohongiella nitratireducens]